MNPRTKNWIMAIAAIVIIGCVGYFTKSSDEVSTQTEPGTSGLTQ